MTPATECRGGSLTISYLFSQFPLPTEAFAVSDIRALAAQGHTVLVHTMKPPRRNEIARLNAADVPGDLKIYRPSVGRALRWPLLLLRRRREALLLVRLIVKSLRQSPRTAVEALICVPRILEIAEEIIHSRSDVVHAFWSRHAGMALPVIRSLGLPAVRSAFVGAYDLVADDFLVDLAVGSAEAVFSHAETNRSYVESKAPSGGSVHIVHRGIPLPALDPTTSRDPDCWITASALVEAKNVEAVLRTFASARSRRPELRLIVCGDGPDRRRLEKYCILLGCAEAVTFSGHVPRQTLFRLMEKCGTFLLLSKKASERLPNVVKEALWSGCSVIVSRSEGIEELIPDEGVGLVVDPDDPRALEKAADAVLEESEGAAGERRSRAHRLIAERFSSEKSMSRYLAVWREAGAVADLPAQVDVRR